MSNYRNTIIGTILSSAFCVVSAQPKSEADKVFANAALKFHEAAKSYVHNVQSIYTTTQERVDGAKKGEISTYSCRDNREQIVNLKNMAPSFKTITDYRLSLGFITATQHKLDIHSMNVAVASVEDMLWSYHEMCDERFWHRIA